MYENVKRYIKSYIEGMFKSTLRFNLMKIPLRSFCAKPVCAIISEDLHHYGSTSNLDKMEQNVLLRKGSNNIPVIRELIKKLDMKNDSDVAKLKGELSKLPNLTHPRIVNYGDEPKELEQFSPSDSFPTHATEFSEVAKYMNIFRMDHLGNYTGHKSYYLFGKLAELEQAIKEYTVQQLLQNNFSLISVPDILPKEVIEGCGMNTDGERTQVYKLDSGLCLSGTSEMALAGFFENQVLEEKQLPIKVAAVSRCYRAETSGLNEEKGIYRVHQFTKVEMFAICAESQSEDVLELFKDLQLENFKKLNLKIRLLDMPPSELGAPAYQKYDIEAWMPGRKVWGEISSSSNCTDYQAKRLNIRYKTNKGETKFAHTVNGTAAAIPRLLIAILESNQVDKNSIEIPKVLGEYMKNCSITKDKLIPEIKLLKHLKHDI
ncbi:serine--tRNA ligase, mitochondrial isoform X2 [Stomoxys calcitrans]|uniref:serine--tRNA ligase, mitochondrial isoform X2 n=1 Tax=Stomoxys calcitrans TaxID=35570 RepID=UPI0027E303A2|nr:serine--tRNA ligase, mitochondrial isoform X2 [Stomoxys calcitrans]